MRIIWHSQCRVCPILIISSAFATYVYYGLTNGLCWCKYYVLCKVDFVAKLKMTKLWGERRPSVMEKMSLSNLTYYAHFYSFLEYEVNARCGRFFYPVTISVFHFRSYATSKFWIGDLFSNFFFFCFRLLSCKSYVRLVHHKWECT